jgi:Bacterial PH domain
MKAVHDDEQSAILRALDRISSILVPGETVEAYAVQRRIFAMKRRRDIVIATTGRLILMRRGFFGGFSIQDVRWQDVKDARITVGILGADIMLEALSAPDIAVAGEKQTLVYTGLRKEEAQAVYRVCQAQEQAWREKRRLRELEELRAKSGGFDMGSARSAAPSPTPGAGDDSVARLQRAKEMLEKGLIADSEYETIKARIVGSL